MLIESTKTEDTFDAGFRLGQHAVMIPDFLCRGICMDVIPPKSLQAEGKLFRGSNPIPPECRNQISL